MGVDYTARKAAKKARKAEGRTSVSKRNDRRGGDKSALDGGSEGGDKKSKRDRPKYGRKGARRMCKGMCYGAAPLLNDDDLEWSPDDHVAPQLLVPKPSAKTMAAAAAGAATLRSVAATTIVPTGGPPGKGVVKARREAFMAVDAPASPEPKARRFSTGIGALDVNGGGGRADDGGRHQKATTLSPGAASHLAAKLTPRYTALAKAGGAWPPTAVQAGVWAGAAAGRDVLAVAPPGSGKTLAFAVPAIAAAAEGRRKAAPPTLCTPSTVILVPARELATQVAAVCTGLRRGGGAGAGVRTGLVVGGVDKAAQAAGIKGAAVLVATPGRLLDLVDAGEVDLGHASVVAVDEADKLLSPGLAPQLDRLRDLLLLTTSPRPLVILASATMPAAVDGAAAGWLKADRVGVVVVNGEEEGEAVADDAAPATSSAPIPAITQAVHVCAAHKKTGKLLKHLAAINAASTSARHRPRVAVFVNRIATASAVASAVGTAGHKVALLHGGRPQAARDAALASFRAGATTILVATDVAARGLHIPTLRHVVNYDFPPNLETYTHRIGRAGRLEDGGHAFSFFTRPLAPLARPLLALLDATNTPVDPNLVRLADAYDEARARVARLPEVEGEDAARAARRAAVGQVLAMEEKGKKKKTKKKTVEGKMEEDSDEEEEDVGATSDDDDGAPLKKRKAKPLAKAELPGLYKVARKPAVVGRMDGGGDEDEEDGNDAWADEEDDAPAAPPSSSSKRRKALPGRLRKKQAAERAREEQGKGGGGLRKA